MGRRWSGGAGCRGYGGDYGGGVMKMMVEAMVVMWFDYGSGVGQPEVSPEKWWRRKVFIEGRKYMF
ncbi:hypothetical protein Tco_0041449, partial [Tanacetum coccineum]